MKQTLSLIFGIVIAMLLSTCKATHIQSIPSTFVYLKDEIPSIIIEPRYYSSDNFIGSRIDGYDSPVVILSKEASLSLSKVQKELLSQDLSLKVFDAYRPQRAVDHFVRWAKVTEDTLMKDEYYPSIEKDQLFKLGYIAEKSGHTRGSTVDLTIVHIDTQKELDMGSPFDFFGVISAHEYQDITDAQKDNRLLIKTIMERHGFKAYAEEWWHYTLIDEPFSGEYFDFPVR